MESLILLTTVAAEDIKEIGLVFVLALEEYIRNA